MSPKVSVLVASVILIIFSGAGLYLNKKNIFFLTSHTENKKVIMNSDTNPPNFKIGFISMDVGALFQAVSERVWVTKYYGAPAEIYKFSSDMPLCDALPEPEHKYDTRNSVFLWQQKRLPIKIKWDVNKADRSGTLTVRMLDFNKVREVLETTFEIIRTDTLGKYRNDLEDKEIVKNLIKKDLDARNFEATFGLKGFLKTYPILEGRYFLEEDSIGDREVTNEPEEQRIYFTSRGKEYALKLEYDPDEFKKKGSVLEYTLTAPVGFFGMEKNFSKEGAK